VTEAYESTRRSLHGVAELPLAGPRYVEGGSIQLRAGAGGSTTWDPPAVTPGRHRGTEGMPAYPGAGGQPVAL